MAKATIDPNPFASDRIMICTPISKPENIMGTEVGQWLIQS